MRISSARAYTFSTATVLAVSILLGMSTDILAQERHRLAFKYPAAATKYTQQYVIDVGDIPEHQVRIYEMHVTPNPSDAPRYAGLRVVESWYRGYSDYTKGTGSYTSYGYDVLENGDKIFWQGSGTVRSAIAADGTRKTTAQAGGSITGGTGKLRGIRGTAHGIGVLEFRDGKAIPYDTELEVEYWFE